jgi:hypothetical protein
MRGPMGERNEGEREAAFALRAAADALRDAAARLHITASDVARWGVQHDEPAVMRLVLADVRSRLAEIDVALAEWDRCGVTADGVYVEDYSSLTNGHRWRVVRSGEVVSRGWAPTHCEAEDAAQAAWEAVDE